MSKEKLPVYKISINPSLSEDGERLGIEQIAYTDKPAILTKGIYFNEQKKQRFADELKMRVAAPALIPMQIYRYSDDLGEYYAEFTVEEIEILVADFMQHRTKDVFNVDHTETLAPSYILHSWIVKNPETDPSFTEYGIEGLPKGTFFIVSQFTDKKFFEEEIIKKGRTGYSIEGFLGLMLKEQIKKQITETQMNKQKLKFADLNAKEGKFYVEGELAVDANIWVINPETLEKEQANDGDITLEDGTTVTIKDGKVAEIKKPEEAPVEETEAAATPETLAEETAPEVAPTIDEAVVMAIVQPHIEEIYKVIAEIKTLIESGETEAPAEVELSKETKMSAMLQLVRQLKK